MTAGRAATAEAVHQPVFTGIHSASRTGSVPAAWPAAQEVRLRSLVGQLLRWLRRCRGILSVRRTGPAHWFYLHDRLNQVRNLRRKFRGAASCPRRLRARLSSAQIDRASCPAGCDRPRKPPSRGRRRLRSRWFIDCPGRPVFTCLIDRGESAPMSDRRKQFWSAQMFEIF